MKTSFLAYPVGLLLIAMASLFIPAAMSSGAKQSSQLRTLAAAPEWLNTQPIRAEELQGKVVLVNFWTYSCINCIRTYPYIRGWAEKYRDQGLVVIGVHTPEFGFEKDAENIRKAARSHGITYPIAIDSDFAIWKAFGNYAWPGFYFIGADGSVRHRKLGEGDYEQSERVIQELLSEAKGASVPTSVVAARGQGAEAAPDWKNIRSGETYLGFDKAAGFSSPGGLKENKPALYRAAPTLSLNRWSLTGTWTVDSEFATLNRAPGGITHRFHARDLHLVLGPSSSGKPIRFRVKIDGAAPGANHGADVDAEGWGTVRETRLYQLIRQANTATPRTFEIEFLDEGVRAYAFTFG